MLTVYPITLYTSTRRKIKFLTYFCESVSILCESVCMYFSTTQVNNMIVCFQFETRVDRWKSREKRI